MALDASELMEFTAGLAAAPERWEHLIHHADDVRVYDSAAAITVISGCVREDRLTLGSEPRSRELGAGSTFTVAPVAIHRVLHAGHVPAVTIHAYSPPLRRTGAYRIGPDGALEREAQTFEVELRAEPALS
jgi:hypothetical protein